MKREDFSYTADANGYFMKYKGRGLGGASVKLPRDKPLHWRHARANIRDNMKSAQIMIRDLMQGRGTPKQIEILTEMDNRKALDTNLTDKEQS